MTPQQRHEQAIAELEILDSFNVNRESGIYRLWMRENDQAVAAYYDKTVEQLETNIQVCWR